MSTIDGERLPSRGGNLSSLRRRYIVDASSSSEPENYVLDWILANSPDEIGGLFRGDMSLEEMDGLADHYEAEVSYGLISRAPPAATGTKEFRFNFQAQGAHIYQSLETILYCTDLGCNANPSTVKARNFKGALNVVSDGGKPRVEGFQIEPPAETFTLAFFPENTVVSAAYQLKVGDICGTVNESSYFGYPAGSLMLVRCTGGIRTGEDWSIDFGFAYIPNDTEIPVGDSIIVDAKDGHDLLWAYYGEEVDGDADALVKQPKAAYVERVWRRSNFSELLLPA